MVNKHLAKYNREHWSIEVNTLGFSLLFPQVITTMSHVATIYVCRIQSKLRCQDKQELYTDLPE